MLEEKVFAVYGKPHWRAGQTTRGLTILVAPVTLRN
jgi:hypothetical protein